MSAGVLIKFLENHPETSGAISIGSIATGHMMNTAITEPHIPAIVMESAQLIIWIIGGIAGSITVHSWLKRHLKKDKKEN